MRIIKAEIKDAFFVHKTMNEFLRDTGCNPLKEADYMKWAQVLDSDNHRYVLLMHSRKVVGMIWGRGEGNDFLLEGKFLRRAYRGKFKFTKKLFKAKMEIVKGYVTIKEVRPACVGIGKRKIKGYII